MAKKISEEKNNKAANVEAAIKGIQAKYGEGAIMKLGEARRVDIDAVPTGSLSLDMALGVGGVPRGRVIEIFGPGKTMKSTLAIKRLL